jgi:hypothetical protein
MTITSVRIYYWPEDKDLELAGHAGIYTISIAEIVDLTETMLQKQAADADRT